MVRQLKLKCISDCSSSSFDENMPLYIVCAQREEGRANSLPSSQPIIEENWQEIKAGSWKQELMQSPWRNSAHRIALRGLLSLKTTY